MTQDMLPPNTPPVTPPPATPPVNNGGNNGDDEQPIMSTAKLKERLERAKEAERTRIFAELGIEDPSADKELLAQARKQAQDDLTEAQKAIAELAKEKAKREKAEQDLAEHVTKADAEKRAATRDSAVTKALTTANAKADKVLKLLRADHAAELDAVLKDDGTADEKIVAALVEVARRDYPEDFGKGGVGSPGHGGGKAPQPGADAEKRASQLNQSRIRG